MEKITKSYKFKLSLSKEQENFLLDYFSRFAKVVNFCTKKTLNIDKEQKENYEYIEDGLYGTCAYCYKTFFPCKEHKPEGKGKICKKCNQNTRLNRRKKSGQELVCQKCWNKEFSIRKILYATKGRKRSQYGDVRDAAILPGTEYASAFKRANDILKALEKQRKKIEREIYFQKKKLQEWKDVLENNSIKYNGKKVQARFILPKEDKQKVERYKHIKDKDDVRRKGKTESQIRQIVKASSKTIEKLEKRIKELTPHFDGNIVDLYNSSLKEINENYIELSIDGNRYKFNIFADKIKNKMGRLWAKNLIEQIKNSKQTYPLLLKQGNNFYFSYPLSKEIESPIVDASAKVMGIDRGVNKIAVSVVVDKSSNTFSNIRFYSGERLMRIKNKYQLIRKKFTGTKSANKRRAKFGNKVGRISDYLLHNISKNIVNEAEKQKPIVIVMENLKLVQGEKKRKSSNSRNEKRLNFKLSNFLYGKLQKLIEYKALQKNIPVRYINPEFTSQKCHECGEIDYRNRKNQSQFQCVKCGYQMNADLNAAINIANAFTIAKS